MAWAVEGGMAELWWGKVAAMFMLIPSPVGGTAGNVDIPSNGGGIETSGATAGTPIIGLERSWLRVRACGWFTWKGLTTGVDPCAGVPDAKNGLNVGAG